MVGHRLLHRTAVTIQISSRRVKVELMVSPLIDGWPIQHITQAIVEAVTHVQVVPVDKPTTFAVVQEHQVHRRHVAVHNLSRQLIHMFCFRSFAKPLPVPVQFVAQTHERVTAPRSGDIGKLRHRIKRLVPVPTGLIKDLELDRRKRRRQRRIAGRLDTRQQIVNGCDLPSDRLDEARLVVYRLTPARPGTRVAFEVLDQRPGCPVTRLGQAPLAIGQHTRTTHAVRSYVIHRLSLELEGLHRRPKTCASEHESAGGCVNP